MASVHVRKELECPLCLNMYTDPVNLSCGHNFCHACIDCVLDTQEECKAYFCPQCRQQFQERPALQRNIALSNIVVNLCSAQPDQEETGVFCTYCIHSPVPAVKSCLQCEASLCDDHLRVHSKSSEHVLCDPTTSLESRKCSDHKKVLEYYCLADSAFICVSCSLAGDHQGHKVQTLDKASEKKKQRLRNDLQELTKKTEETEKIIQSLQEHKRKVEEKGADVTERVTALFGDLRRQLEDLEKRILGEVSKQEEQFSLTISKLVHQLELKKAELSRKMRHIEELCNMTDPLTVLQDPDTGGLCDAEEGDNEDRERSDKPLHDGGDLDVALISQTLHTALSDIMKGVNVCFNIQEPADLLLDVNTTSNYLQISDDMKTATWSDINQNRPETPQRFQGYVQVLSRQSFSSGQHYWEVDVSKSKWWVVGMCYPSVHRRGAQSLIGYNDNSWCLCWNDNQCSVLHDSELILLPNKVSSNRVRIYLDYEAGHLSFYNQCDPVGHLHTFTVTFTEPLHAILCVVKGCLRICGKRGIQDM